MQALAYLLNKYNLSHESRSPIEIPNAGRDTLAQWFCELGFATGAEIGVERGMYSEILCKANPNLHLYSIDAWQGYKGYRDHVYQDKLEQFYGETVERLKPYNATVIRNFSMDAVKQFEDRSLDFVYIDANHEIPWVDLDLYWWSQKVRIGGIVAGHDYYESRRHSTKCHVKYFIDAYMQAFRIRPWFLIGTRAKNPGEVRDTSRSWFYVKYEELQG